MAEGRTVDRDRILALLDTSERYAQVLREIVPDELDDYVSDVRARLATERALQVAIEALVDTASLFVSGLRLGLPPDEENILQRLRQANVLPAAEATLLTDLRRFRNVLVHRYGQLDDKLVHTHAREAPDDLMQIAEAFRSALP